MPDLPVASPRIVVVSPVLPHPDAADAGSRYLQLLREALEPLSEVTYLVPDFPSNRALDTEVGVPERRHVLGHHSGATSRALRWLHLRLARLDPASPYLPFVGALLRKDVRHLLKSADVIDLQWAEMVRLAPLVRRINPHARVVGTFHDVLSQRYSRSATRATSSRQRAKWKWATLLARRSEGRAPSRLDVTVVFSAKDAAILRAPRTARVTVVNPPMATSGAAHPPLREGEAVVVFVGYLKRPENDDAARWLLSEIWPSVSAAIPSARLWLVGAGAGPELTAAVAMRPEVVLTGFVTDLDEIYRQARACIVSLRLGAGVKFKTIEAMVAGVPVVATTIGAEGIAGHERLAGLSDDPEELGASLVDALLAPDQLRATAVQRWAQERYGLHGFHAAIESIYRPGHVRPGLEVERPDA